MKFRWLYLFSLSLASLGAVAIVVCGLSGAARDTFTRPLMIVEAATALVLFIYAVSDSQVRKGIDTASRELRRDWSSISFFKKIFDPKWGLLGSRIGGPVLSIVRTTLWAEFIIALICASRKDNDMVLLATTSFGVAMLLSLIECGLTTPPDKFAW